MATQHYTAQPTSEEIIKKVEQEIVREAKSEEKALKNAVKDLSRTEKDVNKAQKVCLSISVDVSPYILILYILRLL